MKTVFNPVEAMHFAKWLEAENALMLSDLRSTLTEWTNLRANWNDAKYDAYMVILDNNAQALQKFSIDSEKYISYLRKKANIISEYLR